MPGGTNNLCLAAVSRSNKNRMPHNKDKPHGEAKHFRIKGKSLKFFWVKLSSTSAGYLSTREVYIGLDNGADKSYLYITKMGPQTGHRNQIIFCAREYLWLKPGYSETAYRSNLHSKTAY